MTSTRGCAPRGADTYCPSARRLPGVTLLAPGLLRAVSDQTTNQTLGGCNGFDGGFREQRLRVAGPHRRVKNGMETTVANDSNYGQLAAVA